MSVRSDWFIMLKFQDTAWPLFQVQVTMTKKGFPKLFGLLSVGAHVTHSKYISSWKTASFSKGQTSQTCDFLRIH